MEQIQDPKAAWAALQEDEVLRKIAIERLIEGFHELEELIKEYPEKVGEQNAISLENLRNDIDNISAAINALPDTIDDKTEQLRQAVSELHDEFQESKGQVRGAIDEARNNATQKIAEEIKKIQENLKVVGEKTEETISTANKIIESLGEQLEEINKKALSQYVKEINAYEVKADTISKNVDAAISKAFRNSMKNFKIYWTGSLIIITVLQLSMWGFFIYKLLT